MSVMRLISRNMKVFFRDKTAVFFSFLSMLIIIMLYALFLGQINTNSIKQLVGDIEGIRWLVDSWIMAGILVVNSITVSMGVFGIMVNDQAEKKLVGFLVTPVSRGKIVLGYLFSSWVIGIILTSFSLVLAEIYIVMGGGQLLSAFAMFKVFGLIIINVFSASSLLFLVASFIHSTSGFATMSTILGTLIGFVTGVYIPIGMLPNFVQTIVKFVPATHGTALMRQVFIQEAETKVFAGAPASVVEHFNQSMGITMTASDKNIPVLVMILVLVVSGLLFLGLSVLSLNKKHKNSI